MPEILHRIFSTKTAKFGAAVSMLFTVWAAIRWWLDVLGHLQTIHDFLPPTLRFLTSPAFPVVAALSGLAFIVFAYLELKRKHRQAGFVNPETKPPALAIAVCVSMVILVLVGAIEYVQHSLRKHSNASIAQATTTGIESLPCQLADPFKEPEKEKMQQFAIYSIVSEYEKTHNRQSPSTEYVNQELKRRGYDFCIHPGNEMHIEGLHTENTPHPVVSQGKDERTYVDGSTFSSKGKQGVDTKGPLGATNNTFNGPSNSISAGPNSTIERNTMTATTNHPAQPPKKKKKKSTVTATPQTPPKTP